MWLHLTHIFRKFLFSASTYAGNEERRSLFLFFFLISKQRKGRGGDGFKDTIPVFFFFFSNPFFTAMSTGSGSVCPNQSFHCLPQRWDINMALVRWRAISQIYAWAIRAIISSSFFLGNGGSSRDGIICRKCYQGSTDIRCDPATSKFASVDHDYVFLLFIYSSPLYHEMKRGNRMLSLRKKNEMKKGNSGRLGIGRREASSSPFFEKIKEKKKKKRVWAKHVREMGGFAVGAPSSFFKRRGASVAADMWEVEVSRCRRIK